MRPKIYTIGRICGVLVRPAVLFLANNYLGADAAAFVAVVFLGSSLALVATAADPHRQFYVQYFGHGGRAAVTFYGYVAGLTLLTILGAVVVIAVTLRFGAVSAAAVGVCYFASERLGDEVLRLRLFQQDFAGWGRSTVVRSLGQLASLAALFALLGDATPGWAAVLLLTTANALVFVPQLPSSLGRSAAWYALVRLAPRAVRGLLLNWRLWAVALLGSLVGYLDRVIALLFDADSLALFMLVVMSFSIVQMAVDFYYVSRYRREFLQQRITLRQAFTSRDFLGSLGGSLLLASIVAAVVLQVSRNGDTFPLIYVAVIATLQTAVAVTIVPQQILYWNRNFDTILATELVFWAMCGAALAAVWALRLGPPAVFVTVAVCAVARLGLYAVRARRVPFVAIRDEYAVPSRAV